MPQKKIQVLLLIETSRAYGRGLIEGISKYAFERGNWSIHFEDRGLYDRLPHWLKSWKGDGIIARTATSAQRHCIAQLGIPSVELFGTQVPEIGCNDAMVAQMAAEHFLVRGIRHFAFFSPTMHWWCRHRFEHFQQMLKCYGHTCSCFRQKKNRDASRTWNVSGDRELRNWLLELPKPTGLFAATDVYSLTALGACRREGIRVPEEIAILGADNDQTICLSVTPQLSSIDVNNVLTGYTAAALLHERMTLPVERQRTVPIYTAPAYVVTRQSTDMIAVDDDDIVTAMTFLNKNAAEKITVTDIAEHVGLSVRTLRRRFQKYLGRSPEKRIIELKINKARQYLRETNWPLYIISKRVGFSPPEYFVKVFKRETGMTPIQYRKQHQVSFPK